MTPLRWLAAAVFFLQLPIPLFWFVVHPQVNFWRRHHQAGYITGLLLSWFPVTVGLIYFRRSIFRSTTPPALSIAVGLALIVFELWIFWRVKKDLGGARLIGRTELMGGGEIAREGIYGRLRHPRYVGSLLAIVGACFIAGTFLAWILAAVWAFLARLAIAFEERELRMRFGRAYDDYCRQVPRFVPVHRRAHK